MNTVVLQYFGSKFRATKHYPKPKYDTIIEPFAGGAGYSLNYKEKNVILIEKSEDVYLAWDYLIKTSPDKISKLPCPREFYDVNDLDVEIGAKKLISFWITGTLVAKSRKSTTPLALKRLAMDQNMNVWCEKRRDACAKIAGEIKHWKILHGGFEMAPDIEATWFIDPPYRGRAGKEYPEKFNNHDELSSWCKSRRGQVIVCEGVEHGSWLPFEPLFLQDTMGSKKIQEYIWTNESSDK